MAWFAFIFILFGSAKYISDNYYQLMLIQGKSMEPSYYHLQFVVLNKKEKDYEYNDVVAFWCDKLNIHMVKRVVACPGDRVDIEDGTLYINDCISEYYRDTLISFTGIVEEEITLPEGCYFVLGDNVSESKDSRYAEIGLVKKDAILGKVLK